jgi:hypothetical protein
MEGGRVVRSEVGGGGEGIVDESSESASGFGISNWNRVGKRKK